jgi:hypothetical protein
MKTKIYCFFGRHDWSGAENNICSVCGKVAVGLRKFVNPPKPPNPIFLSSEEAVEESEM